MNKWEEDTGNTINDSRSGSLEGRYANYFKVGCNAYEFVIDFGQLYSEDDKAEIYSRIITSPAYAKALISTLQDAINQYKIKYG